MNQFITDIPRQSITIDGVCYTANQLTPERMSGKAVCGESYLQQLFKTQYGSDSFQASLADFLCEWFDGKELLRVYTSGSTGTPKELWVEKQRMMNSARLTVSFLGLQTGDSAQLCMPLKYIAGKMVVVRALVAGLNLILTPPCGHPLERLATPPVFSAMIPMQVFNSLQVPEEKERLKQIKHLIIGGGAVDEAMSRELQHFPYAIWSTYGMTETLSHIALRRLSGKEASDWYTPFPTVSLSLSEEGTLVIDAPQVNPERLITNDIVCFRENGQFRILGRKDNIINTGGVKVQIEQVENALKSRIPLPFLITSVPDAKFGERIVLLVETSNINEIKRTLKVTTSKRKSNAATLGTELIRTLQTNLEILPPYWRPKQILYTQRLPLTETGKPDRANAKKLALKLVENANDINM